MTGVRRAAARRPLPLTFPGEIHDFELTPREPGELMLRYWRQGSALVETRVPVRVREGR